MSTSSTERKRWSSLSLRRSPFSAPSTTAERHLFTESAALAGLTAVILVLLTWASLRVTAMPDAVAASAPDAQFSSARAFEHLKAIAQAPSPTGSSAHASVREYLVSQIEQLGLAAESHSTVTAHPAWSAAFRVENILTRLPGTDSTRAVLIVGHYDSVAGSPGAGDNHLSNAAMLEAIRTLRAREPLRNDIIFLFADAEEYGLAGAYAFVQEHPWAKEIGVVFNYDSSTGQGPLVLQHTAAEDGWLVRHLAAADAGIYLKSQQNSERSERWGQDFDVFEEAGYTAANINNWTNTAFYHTRLDNLDHVDERKLQAYGASMVQLAGHFGGIDLSQTRDEDRVFFSVFDKNFVIHYSNAWTWPLALVAALGVAAVVIAGIRRRRLSARALAVSVAGLLALLVLGAVVAETGWGVIKGLHPEADWQQEQDIYQGGLLLGGLTALVAAGFIASMSWGARRLGIANLQVAALVLVLVLGLYAAAEDPLFSYLALWPLIAVTLATGVSFFIPTGAAATTRHRWLRAGLFWLAAIPVIGVFMPLVVQVLVRTSDAGAAVAVLLGTLLAALLVSLIEIVLPARRWWLAGLAAAAGVALLILGTARSGFTAEQPRPDSLFYVLDAESGAARWATLDDDPDAWIAQFVPPDAEATTAQAVLGIPASAQEDTDWLIPASAAWASAAPPLDAPAPTLDVVADQREGDTRALTLRVASPRGGRVVYVVPEQEVVSASVEGKSVMVTPAWRLLFVGLPPEGVELQLTLRGDGPARLTVLDQTDGLPAALAASYEPEPADTVPAILPRWARGYPAFVRQTFVID